MEGWVTKSLGEVTSIMTKGVTPKYADWANENTMVVLNQKCNRNFEISFEQARLNDCSKKSIPNEKILRKYDVLINSTGTGTAGRVAQLFNINRPMTIDGHMILLRPTAEIDPIYYGYAIKNHQAEIELLAEGSTGQTEINRNRLSSEIMISFPQELSMQRQIGKLLYQIDQKINNNICINNNLEQQALILFKQYFIIDEYLAKPLALYDFAEYINGAAFKPDELGNNGLPVIKIAELKSGIIDSTRYFGGNKGDKYLVFDKDILFSWSGNPDTSIDIFIWASGNGILNQHTFNVKSKYNCPWFTFLLLKYHKPIFTHIASNKQTTGLGHVTAGDLRQLMFPFNQKRMEIFEHMISPIMELYYGNMLENHRLIQLRDFLLPKLISGEINVSNIQL